MTEERARAQLLRAAYLLATGTETIQERVSAAWLELLSLRREDFPVELREAFAVIETEALTAPEDPAGLSEAEAVAAADRLVQVTLRLWQG